MEVSAITFHTRFCEWGHLRPTYCCSILYFYPFLLLSFFEKVGVLQDVGIIRVQTSTRLQISVT